MQDDDNERLTILPSDEMSTFREPLLALGQSLHESQMIFAAPPPPTTTLRNNESNVGSLNQPLKKSISSTETDESLGLRNSAEAQVSSSTEFDESVSTKLRSSVVGSSEETGRSESTPLQGSAVEFSAEMDLSEPLLPQNGAVQGSDPLEPLSNGQPTPPLQSSDSALLQSSGVESSTENDLSEPLLPQNRSVQGSSPGATESLSLRNSAQDPLEPLSNGPSPPPLRRRVPFSNSNQPSSPSRMLDRDASFFQSRGRWSVRRLPRSTNFRHNSPSRRLRIWKIWDDWFHRLAYKPTLVLMGIIFLMYTAAIFFFAFVYLGVSLLGSKITKGDDGSITRTSFCGMDITNHMEALYFSLSTMTSIGYGVSDYYFGDCWLPLLLVLWQSFTALTFSAVAIGLLFQRISRGQKRGKSIVFSNKAVIRRVRGVSYLMFRVGELRRHHLIEATVRAYSLLHERLPVQSPETSNKTSIEDVCEIETTHFLAHPVRLLHPDDKLGSHILMSLPQVVVHRLDEKSPLFPSRPIWYDARGHGHKAPLNGINLPSNEELGAFLDDRDCEIVVLLEGTDELTGSALQARHSYRLEDIEWDHTFAPCVFPLGLNEESAEEESWWSWLRERRCERLVEPACTVDFAKFHDVVPVPSDCDACPFVPKA